jgi:hypothetical protein
MSDRRRGSRRAVLAVLGVAWVAVPALVACRGVLGIHDLTYDAGPGKVDGPSRNHDASDDSGSDDSGGDDTGSADTGAGDSGHDATVKDAGHDTGTDVSVDAGHDARVDAVVDAGHDASEASNECPHGDACAACCVSRVPMDASKATTMALTMQFSPGACSCATCSDCTHSGNPICAPKPPPDAGMPGPQCPDCLAGLLISGCDAGLSTCAGDPKCAPLATCLMKCE